MRARIISVAETELVDAVEYFERQQKGLGLDFLSEFDAAVDRITHYPLAWPLISQNIRRAMFRRFPYALLFKTGEEIVIVAVMQLNRRPDYWRSRE